MTSNFLFSLTTGNYLIAFLLFLAATVFKRDSWNRWIVGWLGLGWILNTVGFGLRIVEFSETMQKSHPEPLSWTRLYQYFPVTNLYESLVLFAWTVVLVFLFLYWQRRLVEIATLTSLLATAALTYASLLSAPQAAIVPLVPALKSNWLLFHVITCFLAYAAFGVAATIAIIYLVRLSQKNPIALQFDQLIYRVILFGFFLLTIGVVLGAVWANESWGSYWSWDPKETWSLITWFVYAGYLHATRTRGWIGKPAAILVLVGFAVTLFCYLV